MNDRPAVAERTSAAPPGRFQIEALEERIAPSAGLLDLNVSMNVSLTGPMKNVKLDVQDVYLVVQNNVIQASTGGTLVGVVG